MGDNGKPQASFLLRKNGAAGQPAAPAGPNVSQAAAPAQGQSALFQPKASLAAAPAQGQSALFQPKASLAAAPAQGQSALFQPKASLAAIPGNAVPPPPGSVRAPSLISGKLKVPGSKTKSVMLKSQQMPKMSAIRSQAAIPAMSAMVRPVAAPSMPNASVFTQTAPKTPSLETHTEQRPTQEDYEQKLAEQQEQDALEQEQGEAQNEPDPAAAQAARASAEQLLQRGLDHYDRGEFDQALEVYQEAIHADPTFAMAHNNKAMVLIDLERYDEAMASLYESIYRDAAYGEAYNNLGFVLRRQGNNLQAAAAYRRFLDLEPDVEESERITDWINTVLGENSLSSAPALEMPERPPEAKPAKKTSAEAPKIKKMAAWEAAAGNTAMAAPVNAIGEYKQNSDKPQSGLAPLPASGTASKVLRTQQVPALATGVFRKPGQATTPEDQNRAINLVEKSLDEFANGNLDEALNLAQQALESDPDCSEAHTSLGKTYVRQEKLKEGIEHLDKAIQLAPMDPAAYYVLGFTLRAMDRNVEAAEVYETFLRLMPDALDGAKMRQWIMHVKGVADADGLPNFEDDGFEDNEPIVTPTDEAYQAAHEKFKTCDGGQTVEDCERILVEDPDHVRAYILLGRAHVRLGDFERAADAFSRALDLKPQSAEALYFLGQCAEKGGDSPKALKSYRRYVEEHPEGPRAERLRAWFLAHGVSETGKGLSQHIQCEWCLRFFDEDEISMHEGKATCNGCLTLMGSTPIQDAAKLEAVDGEGGAAAAVPTERKRGSVIRKLFVFCTGTAAALVALGYFTTLLDPYLAMAGIQKKKNTTRPNVPIPVVANNGQENPSVTPNPQPVSVKMPAISPNFDGTKVKIANTPEKDFSVFSRWTWKPELEGVAELDESLPGWKREFFFKDRPLGMTVEDGTIVWTSESKDADALKRGEKYNVELTIKGYWIGPEGARKDLFSTTKNFTVASQFGYDIGPELDLGLAPETRNIDMLSVDANGDGEKDLIVTHGSVGQGAVQAQYYSADGTKQGLSLADGARYSAACAFPLNGKENTGVLAANWQSGEVKLFLAKGARLEAGPAVKFAPGVVAVAAMEVGRNKTAVAAFSGASGALSISIGDGANFDKPLTIAMPGGGGKGRVLDWNSADLGQGFLVVTPLAEEPLRFVPYNKGEWDKSGAGAVRSPMKDEGVITAAAVVTCARTGARRLALVVGGKNSHVLLMEEKAGKFEMAGSKFLLSGPGLGVVSWDFNHDGCDDLFVVMRDEVCFLFLDENGSMLAGPHFPNPGMLGPVALMGHGGARPDIAVLNENKRARLFKSAGSDRSAVPAKSTAAASVPVESLGLK